LIYSAMNETKPVNPIYLLNFKVEGVCVGSRE
jgi:hypothetical protein